MNYITENELRPLLRSDRAFVLPKDSRLTPAAADLLREWISRHPSAAPEKPEHMTHLYAGKLVCKTHPGILLRGRLDSLECDVLLLMCETQEPWRSRLGDVLELLRQIMAADVKNTALPPWRLGGMEEAQIHEGSHHPENYGYTRHILPSPQDGLLACRLNRLRTATRECELCAISAYMQPEGLVHEDIVLALNRLSSYFYILQLEAAKIK